MTEGAGGSGNTDDRPRQGEQTGEQPTQQAPWTQHPPPPPAPPWGQQPYGQQHAPPQYGQGQPPQYGQPQYGQGQPPQYGQPQYGGPPASSYQQGQSGQQGQYGRPGQHPAPPYGSSAYGAPPGYGPGLPVGVQLASWGQRAAATLLDSLFGFLLVLPGIIVIIAGAVAADDNGDLNATAGTLLAIGIVLVLAAAVVVIWNQAWRMGAIGWSWGKQVMKIKLVRASDGVPPGGGTGLGRYFVRQLLGGASGGIYTLLTYLWPLWDERNQTLDDKIFSTLVVRA